MKIRLQFIGARLLHHRASLIFYNLCLHRLIEVTVKMAEGGYDPCECVCGHEYAMRRLLSFVSLFVLIFVVIVARPCYQESLRLFPSQIQMSQSDCTQNQCFSNCKLLCCLR